MRTITILPTTSFRAVNSLIRMGPSLCPPDRGLACNSTVTSLLNTQIFTGGWDHILMTRIRSGRDGRRSSQMIVGPILTIQDYPIFSFESLRKKGDGEWLV